MTELDRVRAGLERTIGSRVSTIARAAWEERLRSGGRPTRLAEPLEPFRGVQRAPGFQFAAASGAAYTAERGGEAGIHHVRLDVNDPPEGRINTDSYLVIEDLVADARWAEVLRVAGIADGPEIQSLVRAQVFAYGQLGKDHWNPAIPDHIAEAKLKDLSEFA